METLSRARRAQEAIVLSLNTLFKSKFPYQLIDQVAKMCGPDPRRMFYHSTLDRLSNLYAGEFRRCFSTSAGLITLKTTGAMTLINIFKTPEQNFLHKNTVDLLYPSDVDDIYCRHDLLLTLSVYCEMEDHDFRGFVLLRSLPSFDPISEFDIINNSEFVNNSCDDRPISATLFKNKIIIGTTHGDVFIYAWDGTLAHKMHFDSGYIWVIEWRDYFVTGTRDCITCWNDRYEVVQKCRNSFRDCSVGAFDTFEDFLLLKTIRGSLAVAPGTRLTCATQVFDYGVKSVCSHNGLAIVTFGDAITLWDELDNMKSEGCFRRFFGLLFGVFENRKNS
jgi:hypothetical protein